MKSINARNVTSSCGCCWDSCPRALTSDVSSVICEYVGDSSRSTPDSLALDCLPRALQTVFIKHRVPQCTLLENTPQVEHDRLENLLLFCQTIVLHFSFDVPVAMLATVLSTSSLGRCWVVIGYPVSPRVRVESLRTLFLEQEQFHGLSIKLLSKRTPDLAAVLT
ncbi:hypothetical protein L0F63_007402 [Massospora cicadina]|nr:hypothetical protein L0F63_007402 [Massospora cicadina]